MINKCRNLQKLFKQYDLWVHGSVAEYYSDWKYRSSTKNYGTVTPMINRSLDPSTISISRLWGPKIENWIYLLSNGCSCGLYQGDDVTFQFNSFPSTITTGTVDVCLLLILSILPNYNFCRAVGTKDIWNTLMWGTLRTSRWSVDGNIRKENNPFISRVWM